MIADYRALLEKLAAVAPVEKNRELLFTRATIGNRISYLSYMLDFVRDKDWNKKWAARDAAMAANIEWLRDNYDGDQPIIIIAHNFHIAKWNKNESTMGNLRESRSGVKRADIIIVTKCPNDLSEIEQNKIKKKVGLDSPIFFSSIAYDDSVYSSDNSFKVSEIKIQTIQLKAD